MTEPRTEAGRDLLAYLNGEERGLGLIGVRRGDAILAIEAEAADLGMAEKHGYAADMLRLAREAAAPEAGALRDALRLSHEQWGASGPHPGVPYRTLERAVREYLDSLDRAALAKPEIAASPEAGALRDAAREVVDATDALDEFEVNHEEWLTAARAPFAGRLSLAIDALRAALAASPAPEYGSVAWHQAERAHYLAALEAGALRDALFDEYGVNVVDEALDVAIHSSRETQVNRDRWNAARLAIRAALAASPAPHDPDVLRPLGGDRFEHIVPHGDTDD